MLKARKQPVSSADARELGCRSLFQVTAVGMTELLATGRSSSNAIESASLTDWVNGLATT
jgi:hypothetical protein